MQPLGLAIRPVRPADVGPFVPVEAEPAQILEDARLRLARRALGVGVLDAQDERAVLAVREQPVEQRGARVADVQVAGGLGAKRTRMQIQELRSRLSRLRSGSRVTQQRHRVRGDGFAAADGIDAFVRLAFDADTFDGERRAHPRAPRESASRCGAIFGRSSTTTTSTLTTRKPGARTIATAWRSSSMLDAPFQRGSVSGKCRPMSPAHAAPRIASVAAWQTTSASECPSAPARDGIVDAAKDQRPSFDQAMQIVAGADASGRRAIGVGRGPRAAPRQIVSGRDLQFSASPSTIWTDDRRARPASPRRWPRRPDSPSATASQDLAPERLRRLRQDRSIRGNRLDDRQTAGPVCTRLTVSVTGCGTMAAPYSAAASIARVIVRRSRTAAPRRA